MGIFTKSKFSKVLLKIERESRIRIEKLYVEEMLGLRREIFRVKGPENSEEEVRSRSAGEEVSDNGVEEETKDE